jgi:hypothetical protein
VQDQISGNHSSGAGHRNSDIGVEHPHPPSVDEYDDFDSAFDDDFLQQIQLPGVRLSEEYEPLPHPSIQLQSQSPQPQPPQSQSQPRQPRRPSDRAWALTGIFRRPAHSPAPSPSPLPSMFPRPAATSAGVNTLEDDVESISAFSDGEERSYEYDSAARGRAGLFNATHENENEYQEAEVEDSIDEPDPTPPPPTKPRKRVRWADQQPRFADPGFTIWRDEY